MHDGFRTNPEGKDHPMCKALVNTSVFSIFYVALANLHIFFKHLLNWSNRSRSDQTDQYAPTFSLSLVKTHRTLARWGDNNFLHIQAWCVDRLRVGKLPQRSMSITDIWRINAPWVVIQKIITSSMHYDMSLLINKLARR